MLNDLLKSSPKAIIIKLIVAGIISAIVGAAAIAEHDAEEIIDEMYPKKDKKNQNS